MNTPKKLAVLYVLSTAPLLAADMEPYLQSPRPDSIWINWKTSSGTESTVEYGLTAGNLNLSTSGANQVLAADYNYHSVRLTGLSPNTFYHYRVKTGGQTSPVYRFRTPPPLGTNTGHIRFLVLGDHQARRETYHQTLVARAKAKVESLYGVPIEEAIHAVLNVGDQVDVGTLDHYENLHFAQSALISRNVPTMATVGNHELIHDSGLARYKSFFHYDDLEYGGIDNTSPGDEEYYAWQIANIVVVHLNTENTSSTQTNWVQANVNQAKNDPNVDWMISIGHRPYQAEQYIGDISHWARNTIIPILGQTEKHTLFIGGHHHLYARGQVRDYPMYHIISGGTTPGQYWGISNEVDYDDTQKTIANWAWQIIDIDLAARRMNVQCFSEAHPLLGFVYQHKEIDQFHRQHALAAPDKPSITNPPAGPINLTANSYTFTSSAFSTSSGEALNSVHFQISPDPSFLTFEYDRIRDVENIYGDTGAPDYDPVDIHQGLNILEHFIGPASLATGMHYVRVRHRDTNVLWSDWSDAVAFEVIGGGTGTAATTLNKLVYAVGEALTATWAHGPGNATDWIGIYDKGDIPGVTGNSTAWTYTPQPAGTHVFNSGLVSGNEYYLGFFENDGYGELAPRVPFYVGPVPALTTDRADAPGEPNMPEYDEGEDVIVNWANAQGNPSDKIRVFKVGHVAGVDAPAGEGTASIPTGNHAFAGLPKGFYYANYYANDGDFAVAESIPFAVGDEIATISLPKATFARGEDIPVTFSDGAGIPKDWLGIFPRNSVPGVTQLVAYIYFDGAVSGAATFTEEIPPGDYFLAMYINDSYTQISNGIDFTVLDQVQHEIQNGGFDDSTGNLADDWNNLGGSIRGGPDGGFGWTGSYFAGGVQPTGNSFATTLDGPVRQDLAETFEEGRTYVLSADLFSASNYGSSRDGNILWTLALTANGAVVARDHWFSDEFSSQNVSNGGAIPDDHVVVTNSTTNQMVSGSVVFTADASVDGQTIGILLGGNTDHLYGTTSPAPEDYYGMMDNIALVSFADSAAFRIKDHSFDQSTFEITLSWSSNPIPGTVYAIQASADLGVTDPWAILPNHDNIPTEGFTTERSFSALTHGSRHFYRILEK